MTGTVPEYLRAKQTPEVKQEKPQVMKASAAPAPKPKPQASLDTQQNKINKQMSVFDEEEKQQYGPTKAKANKLAEKKGEPVPYPEAQQSGSNYESQDSGYNDPNYKPGPRVENVQRLEESKQALQGTGLENDVEAQQRMMQLKPEEREKFEKVSPEEKAKAIRIYEGKDLQGLSAADKAKLEEYEKQYPGISKMSETGLKDEQELMMIYRLHATNPELADALLKRKNIDGFKNLRYDPTKHLKQLENAEKSDDPTDELYRSMLETVKNGEKPSPQAMMFLRNLYLSEVDPVMKAKYEREYKFMQGQISSQDYIDITKTEQAESVQMVKGAVEAEQFLANVLLDPKMAIVDWTRGQVGEVKGNVVKSGIDRATGADQKLEPYVMQDVPSTGNTKEDINNLLLQEALYNTSVGKSLTSQQVEAVLNSPEYKSQVAQMNLQQAEIQAAKDKAEEYKGYYDVVAGGSEAGKDFSEGYSQGLNQGLTSQESLKSTGAGVLTKILGKVIGDEIIKAASENEYRDVKPVEEVTEGDVAMAEMNSWKNSSVK